MNREEYQKAKEIFQSALEIAPEKRATFVAGACAGDEILRVEVESLLGSFESEFLENGVAQKIAEQIVNNHRLIGQNINRYKILEKIGVGGMGEVFLGEDNVLNRKVAVKVLPERVAGDNERVRRFIREARAASALNHPNILTIYEIGEDAGLHYIASEYVIGETLRERFKREKLPFSEILEITAQIASALQAAHEAGIIHRDIKPENIMLRRDGLVKVLDFGLAKLAEIKPEQPDFEAPTLAQAQTAPGMIMGTTAYMSPEQARGLPVDARTDIWSLGVCLYEMATGKLPFEGETTGDLIVSILKTEITSLEVFNQQIPQELQPVLQKALTKNLDERYQIDAEFLRDLKQLKKSFETADEVKITGESRFLNHTKDGINLQDTDGNQKTATANPASPISTKANASETTRQKFGVSIFIAGLLIIGIGFGVYWIAANGTSFVKLAGYFQPKTKLTFSSIKVTRLTNSGSAFSAAISPDGKYVAYEMRNAGKNSLWLMGIGTSSNVQIAAPTDANFIGITFSPAGDYLYYLSAETTQNPSLSLYRIPMLGGEAKKLISAIDSPISFSPDGKRFAFIRNNRADGTTALIAANADGTDEQIIAQRKPPESFSAKRPAWSPSGETIACIGVNSGSSFARVVAVNVAGGAQKQLTLQDWFSLQDAAWLPGDNGLLLTAQDDRNFGPLQIWRLQDFSGNGKAEKVTPELNNYLGLSLSADASLLVTVQSNAFNNIWLISNGDSSRAKQILSNKGGGRVDMSWTRDGRIVYTSNASGNPNIFTINSDGTNQAQLTSDTFVKRSPVVSPDDRYIIFVSNQAGMEQIWRMDIDGKNQKQLTSAWTYLAPIFTPDGKSVIYLTWQDKTAAIHKVSIDGGESLTLREKLPFTPIISPDMKLIAYHEKDAKTGQAKIKVIPFDGEEIIKTFDIPASAYPNLSWSPDSRSVIYRNSVGGAINLWQLPLNESAPKQLTDFKYDPPVHCEFSRDGKNLSCVRTALIRDIVLFNNLQ